MIYLASPYSHPEPEVRQRRFEEVLEQTALWLRRGHPIFSPIIYGHPLSEARPSHEFEDWQFLNERMIDAAAEVWVLKQEGWDRSRGVAAEIMYARKLGKNVRFLEVL